MGFSLGTADDLLLTCIVCKNPFGMTAQFCGECGAIRVQALGVERTSTRQNIVPNYQQTLPSGSVFGSSNNQQSAPANFPPVNQPGKSVFDSGGAPTGGPNSNRPQGNSISPQGQRVPNRPPMQPQPPRENLKKKERAFKRQIRKQNRRLRIDRFTSWQDRRSPIVFTAGVASLLLICVVLTQSYLFAGASPADAADRYILDGTSRNANYQNINDGITGAPDYPFFPVKYSKWVPARASFWSNNYSWNGWLGTATVTSVASSKDYPDDVLEFKMDATYKKKWGIFREVEWKPANHAATLKLTYPADKSLIISINGFAAGTVGNPAVKPGNYYLYPGQLDIIFYDKYGNKANYDQNIFVGLYGERVTVYN
jgi:hypothetical protein